MGLYIPKMTMPKNCYDCQIENDVPNCPVYMYYSATEYIEKRHPNCPLVEIPEPHGRLIDVKDLSCESIFELDGMIKNAPTIIEAQGE